MTRQFDFKDINLVPKYFDGLSRTDLDVSVELGKYIFKNPVIPANMESVINEDLCIKLAKEGYFYIMHRFQTDIVEFSKNMKELELLISISIGVQQTDKDLLITLSENGIYPDYITIDIAHGHSRMMKEMISYVKEIFPNTFIIAGNISTYQACFDLEQWGANAVKIGVAPGFVCTTAMMTGFGSRGIQASTIQEITQKAKVPVIADGGISLPGDIAKALVLGATMCMCGNLVTGCSDSPGKLVEDVNTKEQFIEYYGSASEFNSGKTNRIEGTKKLVPYKGKTLLEQMNYINECLQSSISYGGGKTLNDLKYVRYVFNN